MCCSTDNLSVERVVEAEENRYSAIISADLDDVAISSGLAELNFSLDGEERRATLRFLNVWI